MKKKYGIVVFKNTENLGDDIQSYAAYKQLEHVDYFIEREELSEFISTEGEIVNTLLSGWYLHNPFSLIPSPFINPFFISIHFTDFYKKECPFYLNEHFLNYLKKYEPIGLRDNLVSEYLSDFGIKNYFSGCLTLTIPKFENVKRKKYICAVDIENQELEHLKEISNFEIKEFTHKINKESNSKLSYEKRFELVEKRLKIYQQASLVVTSRLHCALPCLALGTPVILISDNNDVDKKNRLGIFLEYLNSFSKQDFLEKVNEKNINDFNNKEDYKKLVKKLNSEIKLFEKNSLSFKKNNELKEFYKNHFIYSKKYYESLYNHKCAINAELYKKIDNIYYLNDMYNASIADDLKEIEKIKKNRMYKFLKKTSNFFLKKTK